MSSNGEQGTAMANLLSKLDFTFKPTSEAQGSGEAQPDFKRFPKLPKELREQIWELSVPPPQLIEVKYKLYFRGKELCTAKYKVPALLHVNQESRSVGEKIYEKKFGDRLRGGGVWMNTSKDVLYFNCTLAWTKFFCVETFNEQTFFVQHRINKPLMEKLPALALSHAFMAHLPKSPLAFSKMGQPHTIYYVDDSRSEWNTGVGSSTETWEEMVGWLFRRGWARHAAWLKIFKYEIPSHVRTTSGHLRSQLAASSLPVPNWKRVNLAKAYLKNTCFQQMY